MRTSLTLTLLLSLLTAPSMARELAGIDVPESVLVGEESTRLQLNGAGIRSKFFFKIYVGALYLREPSSKVDRILTMPGAKRVAMHILYKQVSTKKLTDGWNEGFAGNSSPTEFGKLQPRLGDFNKLFVDVHKGDVINLDWIPGTGTRVSINDQLRGSIRGEDFYWALLKVWLGLDPADEDLKQGLLGNQ